MKIEILVDGKALDPSKTAKVENHIIAEMIRLEEQTVTSAAVKEAQNTARKLHDENEKLRKISLNRDKEICRLHDHLDAARCDLIAANNKLAQMQPSYDVLLSNYNNQKNYLNKLVLHSLNCTDCGGSAEMDKGSLPPSVRENPANVVIELDYDHEASCNDPNCPW